MKMAVYRFAYRVATQSISSRWLGVSMREGTSNYLWITPMVSITSVSIAQPLSTLRANRFDQRHEH